MFFNLEIGMKSWYKGAIFNYFVHVIAIFSKLST